MHFPQFPRRRRGRNSAAAVALCLLTTRAAPGLPAELPGPPAGRNLLSLGRMGAGAPAGWRIRGSAYTWEAETEPGPLGVGAARLRLGEHGRVELDSPARFMRAGASHAMSLWLRSDPPGATVRMELRDNDGSTRVVLKHEATAGGDWRRTTMTGTLSKAVKDRYFLTLTASGSNCTLWLDGLWVGEQQGATDESWRPDLRPAGVAPGDRERTDSR
jgi:hypothetical protein